MVFDKKISILDYKIKNDLILYNHKLKLSHSKKSQIIGFSLGRIKNFFQCFDCLHELFREELIESFSIEIQISNKQQNILLSLIIQAENNESVIYKFKKIKNNRKFCDIIELYHDQELESAFFSILIENMDDWTIKKDGIVLTQDKMGIFLTVGQDPTKKPQYLFLKTLNIDAILKDSNSISVATNILEITNTQGSIIMNFNKINDRYTIESWMIIKDENLTGLEKKIVSNLRFLGIDRQNQVRFNKVPYLFLRITQKSSPTTINTLFYEDWKKIFNYLNPDLGLIYNKQAKTHKEEKIDSINPNMFNSIEKIIMMFDNNYKNKEQSVYELFSGTYLVFIFNFLKKEEILKFIHYLGLEYKEIIIYFTDKEMLNTFFEKITHISLKRIHLTNNISDLIDNLNIAKIGFSQKGNKTNLEVIKLIA